MWSGKYETLSALLLHGEIPDEYRPNIGAGLGDHQHPDHGDGIRPQNDRDVKAKAQYNGHIHRNARSPWSLALR